MGTHETVVLVYVHVVQFAHQSLESLSFYLDLIGTVREKDGDFRKIIVVFYDVIQITVIVSTHIFQPSVDERETVQLFGDIRPFIRAFVVNEKSWREF